jgi:hypothetical protein
MSACIPGAANAPWGQLVREEANDTFSGVRHVCAYEPQRAICTFLQQKNTWGIICAII